MKAKNVFQTDPHGFFLYPTMAHELNLSPDSFNVPYGAVEMAPPAAKEGSIPKWDGSAWTVVEDHRDLKLYIARDGAEYQFASAVDLDGESVTYDGGGPIPSWLTETPPAPTSPAPVDE